jgi:hypothetical protein
VGHDGAGSDERACADRDAAQNGRPTSNGGSSTDPRRNDGPVLRRLKAISSRGARISVVREDHAVADEDVVFNRDAFADKAVGRNLAATAYVGSFLDFDERADLRLGADATSI